MQELIEAAVALGWLQWLAVLFNVLYVILAARSSIWCWAFGFVGVGLLFFIYVDARLYSDASLQIFYAAMAIYGFWSWRHLSQQEHRVRRMPGRQHAILGVIGILGAWALGTFWTQFGAALPYIDALTTSFSILATYMVARRYLSNWLYWIVIDLVCVWVYLVRDLPLIAALFFVYSILAVYGYLRWKKQLSPMVR